jgi:hypothetical protein
MGTRDTRPPKPAKEREEENRIRGDTGGYVGIGADPEEGVTAVPGGRHGGGPLKEDHIGDLPEPPDSNVVREHGSPADIGVGTLEETAAPMPETGHPDHVTPHVAGGLASAHRSHTSGPRPSDVPEAETGRAAPAAAESRAGEPASSASPSVGPSDMKNGVGRHDSTLGRIRDAAPRRDEPED